MKIQLHLPALLLGLATAGLAAQATESSPARPNILFIMVDEMKWNVMSCAGHPIVKTPHR
jgi:hypothetical protein